MSEFKNSVVGKLTATDKNGKVEEFGIGYKLDDLSKKSDTIGLIVETIGYGIVNSKKDVIEAIQKADLKFDISYGNPMAANLHSVGSEDKMLVQVIVCSHCNTSFAVYDCWHDTLGDHMAPQANEENLFCPNCGKKLHDK